MQTQIEQEERKLRQAVLDDLNANHGDLTPNGRELYAAAQALAWVLTPESVASPFSSAQQRIDGPKA